MQTTGLSVTLLANKVYCYFFVVCYCLLFVYLFIEVNPLHLFLILYHMQFKFCFYLGKNFSSTNVRSSVTKIINVTKFSHSRL